MRPQRTVVLTVASFSMIVALGGSPVFSGVRPDAPGPGPTRRFDHGGNPGHDPIGPIRQALHQLNLDPDQRQRVRATFERHRDGEMRDAGRAFLEARRALEVRIWNLDASEAEILEASKLVVERARAFERARRSLALDVLPILSAEQQNAFRAELEKMPAPGGPPRQRMR